MPDKVVGADKELSLLVHVQSLCYDAACFSSEVVQTGIPELDIGFMREPA